MEVLRQIKAHKELCVVPVVILTSSREEHGVLRSYRLGTNAYVVKPVDFHEFVDAVKEVGVFWAMVNEPPPHHPSGSSDRSTPRHDDQD